MIDTIFMGTGALQVYADDLRRISHNTNNMNTPGFKGMKSQFADQYTEGRDAGNGMPTGIGVKALTSLVSFSAADTTFTGDNLNLAIRNNDKSFFVLRNAEGKTLYTRNGQFRMDDDGFLVSGDGSYRVAALGAGNQLEDISLERFADIDGRSTSTITFGSTTNLNTNATPKSASTEKITIFDSAGGTHQLILTFTQTSGTPNTWALTVADNNGFPVGIPNSVTFDASGNLTMASKNMPLFYTYFPPSGQPVTFNVAIGSIKSSSGLGGQMGSLPATANGYGRGAFTKAEFNAAGEMVFSYSNGQNQIRKKIALASFHSTNHLEQVSGGMFKNNDSKSPKLGTVGAEFGAIQVGRLEGSNIELTKEFGDLIVTQRGYAAASGVITAANEMIEKLFTLQGGK